MAVLMMTVQKLGPTWHVQVLNRAGSVERTPTQAQAVSWVVGVYTYRMANPTIQLLIFDERGMLEEILAIKQGSVRKLELLLP